MTTDDFTTSEISIEQMYSYLTDIDSLRSLVNIASVNNQVLLNGLADANKKDSVSNIIAQLEAVSNPQQYQESRISAFCRSIGFPVIAGNGEFFSPGYDKSRTDSSKIYNIVANQNKDRNAFFDAREKYYNTDIPNIFNKQNTIDSGTAIIQSLFSTDIFGVFQHNAGYKDTDTSNYLYTLKQKDVHGYPFNKYTDDSNNVAKPRGSGYHYIFPLVTDGRVEITVKPSTRRTTVPFIQFNSDSKYANTELKRPTIERIIKDRFFIPAILSSNSDVQANNSQNANQSQTNLLNLLNDEFLFAPENKQIADLRNSFDTKAKKYSDDEVIRLTKFIKTLEQLVDLLIENQHIVEEASDPISGYYWLPISSTSPEFGCTSTKLFQSALNSGLDREILGLDARNSAISLLNNATLDAVPTDKYVFNQFLSVFSPNLAQELRHGNKATQQKGIEATLQEEVSKRNERLDKANNAIKNIEILCGHFSGLGLFDVIVIMSSLYMIDKNNLLGFLDNAAYIRAQASNPYIQLPEKPGLEAAYDDLDTQMNQLYQFIHVAYERKIGNGN